MGNDRKVMVIIFMYFLVILHLVIFFFILMWCLWRERNNQSFEDTERTMLHLKLFFLGTLLVWMSVFHCQSLCSIIDLIDLCNLRE